MSSQQKRRRTDEARVMEAGTQAVESLLGLYSE